MNDTLTQWWIRLLSGDRTGLVLDVPVGPFHLHAEGRAVFFMWVTLGLLAIGGVGVLLSKQEELRRRWVTGKAHGVIAHPDHRGVLGLQTGSEDDRRAAAGAGMGLGEPFGHLQQGAALRPLGHRDVHDAGEPGGRHGRRMTRSSRWMTSRSYCRPSSRARSLVERPSSPGSSSDE